MKVEVEYMNWNENSSRTIIQNINCKTETEFKEILKKQFHPMFGRYLLGYKILN